MQRYLTGRSIAQSRLSLLFNAVAKIPMQFFILFIGAMVFVFYLFVQPPVLFQHAELARIQATRRVSSPWPTNINRPSNGAARPPWRWWRRTTPAIPPPRARSVERLPRRAAARSTTRAPGAAKLVEQTRRREGLQRHQLHLSLVRDALSAGRALWDW